MSFQWRGGKHSLTEFYLEGGLYFGGSRFPTQKIILLCFVMFVTEICLSQEAFVKFADELQETNPKLVSKTLLSSKCSENKKTSCFYFLPVVLKSIKGWNVIYSPK